MAKPVIDAVLESVQRFRTDEAFNSFLQLTEQTLNTFDEQTPRPQRIRQRSSRLNNSIVMETLGEDSREVGLKPVYFEIIDSIISEINKRFHENSDILMALSELNEINTNFDRKILEPLQRIGLTLPSDAEFQVVLKYFVQEKEKPDNAESSNLKILLPVRSAFSETYRLFEACKTFGSSTSVNECAFSALASC